MVVEFVLAGWAIVMALIDFRERRIPNAGLLLLLVPAALALLLQPRGLLGASGLDSLGGALLLLVATVPGYLLGRLGAGDVKFATCLGLLLGIARGVEMLLVAFLLLGGLAMLITMRGGPRSARFAAAPALVAAFLFEMAMGPVLAIWSAPSLPPT